MLDLFKNQKDEEKQEPKRTASPLMSRRPRTNSRSTSPKLKDLDGVGVEGPGEECDDWPTSEQWHEAKAQARKQKQKSRQQRKFPKLKNLQQKNHQNQERNQKQERKKSKMTGNVQFVILFQVPRNKLLSMKNRVVTKIQIGNVPIALFPVPKNKLSNTKNLV